MPLAVHAYIVLQETCWNGRVLQFEIKFQRVRRPFLLAEPVGRTHQVFRVGEGRAYLTGSQVFAEDSFNNLTSRGEHVRLGLALDGLGYLGCPVGALERAVRVCMCTGLEHGLTALRPLDNGSMTPHTSTALRALPVHHVRPAKFHVVTVPRVCEQFIFTAFAATGNQVPFLSAGWCLEVGVWFGETVVLVVLRVASRSLLQHHMRGTYGSRSHMLSI